MHLAVMAGARPEHPAYVDTAGTTATYAELDRRSRRFAALFRRLGLERGDGLALLVGNSLLFFELAWAAQRAGLRWTPINTHLAPREVAHIVVDSEAKALVTGPTTAALAALALELVDGEQESTLVSRLAAGEPPAGFDDLEAAADRLVGDDAPWFEDSEGIDMLYSSGTTGLPKGVRFPVPDHPLGTPGRIDNIVRQIYRGRSDSVFLVPAPLYHASALRFSMAFHRLGATVVVMERFDPVAFLGLIERHRVTHTAMVPTMFNRLLALPPEVRGAHDVSSLECVVHGAAPCPQHVKREMIEWLGPVLHEYYAATEGVGYCAIDATDWLAHPGSVGRPVLGVVHVVDDHGAEVPPGVDGVVYFEGRRDFAYHNDPAKTAAALNEAGWVTLGDIGHVDTEGYLYLTDRQADLIISGGVNIYPREIEDVLIRHPAIDDAAVVGVADDDLGERVHAVVTLTPGWSGGAELEAELAAHCRSQLARYKCPRHIEFVDELPRNEAGKMLRRVVRDRYR